MSSKTKTLSVRFRFDMEDMSDRALHDLLSGLKPLSRGDLLKPATRRYLAGLLAGLSGSIAETEEAAFGKQAQPDPPVKAATERKRKRKPRPGRRGKDQTPVKPSVDVVENDDRAATFEAIAAFSNG